MTTWPSSPKGSWEPRAPGNGPTGPMVNTALNEWTIVKCGVRQIRLKRIRLNTFGPFAWHLCRGGESFHRRWRAISPYTKVQYCCQTVHVCILSLCHLKCILDLHLILHCNARLRCYATRCELLYLLLSAHNTIVSSNNKQTDLWEKVD